MEELTINSRGYFEKIGKKDQDNLPLQVMYFEGDAEEPASIMLSIEWPEEKLSAQAHLTLRHLLRLLAYFISCEGLQQ